jgi:AcrR family transcriptional regulator
VAGNRERALRAAVELLGGGGVRALTHGRVDAAAGLPKGSTSNHFRTRQSLLDGVLAWMLEQQLTDVAPALEVATVDDLVDALTRLFALLTGPEQTMTRARLALIVEAGHAPGLRSSLAAGRRTMIEALHPALERLGAPDPELAAQTLAACFQGLFLQDLIAEELDPEPVIDLVVRAAVGR